MKIYSPDLTAKILDAMQSIELSNNGYADIGNNAAIADALRDAGFVVNASTNLHGNATFIAYTKRAQKCLQSEPFAVSRSTPIPLRVDGPDYEGMILRRQERVMMDY